MRRATDGHWRRGFDGNPAFAPLERRSWPNRGEPGRDVVLARAASMSFVAALDEEPRERVVAEVAELLDTHPDTRGRDDMAFPYVTELFTTRRLYRPDGDAGLPCAARLAVQAPPSTGRGTA